MIYMYKNPRLERWCPLARLRVLPVLGVAVAEGSDGYSLEDVLADSAFVVCSPSMFACFWGKHAIRRLCCDAIFWPRGLSQCLVC